MATDLAVSIVGLRYGTKPLAYYWTYFVGETLFGSLLLIWMSREMFAELYRYHPGLRGLTQHTLRRSFLVGSAVTLALAPIGFIHWGESDFQCWQFPFTEVHRCLTVGVVVFVVSMWRKLRLLPLTVPRNVKTYASSTCIYLASCGLAYTAILIEHTRFATKIWSVVIIAVSLLFYGVLAALAERPAEVGQIERVPVDPQEIAWLSSISILLARADEAQRLGRASTLKHLPFVGLLSSFHSLWKACARVGSVFLGLAQKE